jgi:hypothetical protein
MTRCLAGLGMMICQAYNFLMEKWNFHVNSYYCYGYNLFRNFASNYYFYYKRNQNCVY